MRAPLVVVVVLASVLPAACASSSSSLPAPAARGALRAVGDLPAGLALAPDLRLPAPGDAPARLPSPDTTLEAQAYLSGAIAALRANQPRHATVFIDAILRSDHLTDRGRANVYWLSAEAHRQAGDDRGLVDSLGGFLVAAAVLEPDEELRGREVEARASLVARKLKDDPRLGSSPAAAIPVEDARDPSGIVAELGCVENGKEMHEGPVGARLEERRVTCSGGSLRQGGPVVLWFDLTHSH